MAQEGEMHEIHGVQVGGREPKALMLSDGTRLALEDDESPGGRVEWTRHDGTEDGEEVSVTEALNLAGENHAEYVTVRTRAEIEWLNLVSEWYREQAERLSLDLAAAY